MKTVDRVVTSVLEEAFEFIDPEMLHSCDTVGDDLLCTEGSGVLESGASFEYEFLLYYYDPITTQSTTITIENAEGAETWEILSFYEIKEWGGWDEDRLTRTGWSASIRNSP